MVEVSDVNEGPAQRRSRELSPVEKIKSRYFGVLSQAVVEVLGGLINSPFGYRGLLVNQFGRALETRNELNYSCNELCEYAEILHNRIFPRCSVKSVSESLGRWGDEARAHIKEVEAYLKSIYAGIPELKDFSRFSVTNFDPEHSPAGDVYFDDGDDTAQIKAMARSITMAELHAVKSAIVSLCDPRQNYADRSLFDPMEIVAATASSIFYGNIATTEESYFTQGSKEGLRDFLLFSSAIFGQIVDAADMQRLKESSAPLLNHAGSVELIEERILRAEVTDCAINLSKGWLTLTLSGIPPATFKQSTLRAAVAELETILAEFKKLRVIDAELAVDTREGEIGIKIPLPKSVSRTDEQPETVERLLAIEHHHPHVAEVVEIPWEKEEREILGRVEKNIILDPLGREALSMALEGVHKLFDAPTPHPHRVELFFDERTGAATAKIAALKAGNYGLEILLDAANGSLHFDHIRSEHKLKEPLVRTQGSCLRMFPGVVIDDELSSSLGGLITTVPRFYIEALKKDNFIKDSDENRKILASVLRATTKFVDSLRAEARRRGSTRADDLLVMITPKSVTSAKLPLYFVQIFDSQGIELGRYKGCSDDIELIPMNYNKNLWRIAYTKAEKLVSRMKPSEHIAAMYETFSREGLSITESFAEQIWEGLARGNAVQVVASSFMDPQWIVRKDSVASRIYKKPCIAMGLHGDSPMCMRRQTILR